MNVYNLGTSRHLCWDDMLIDVNNNTDVVMHKPEKKELSHICVKDWEGIHNGYASIMNIDGTYRMYYRAMSDVHDIDGKYKRILHPAYCMITSKDGKKFTYPKLGVYDINGTDNNIIHYENKYVDNFSVFYDKNPNCPPNEKYKALKMGVIDGKAVLYLHTSEDGLHFSEPRLLDLKGEYDTFNVMLWDEETKQYFIYYRGYHPPKYKSYDKKAKDCDRIDESDEIRDIRIATTKDFITFEQHGEIIFLNDKVNEDIQYYTNNVFKYPRAKDMFLAMPTRYIDRKDDAENFKKMPIWGKRQNVIKMAGRGGTALTDTILMTSRDGFNFKRTNEAFFTPGIECDANWWYGDGYFAYGMEETESDIPGAPNELSLYVGEGYRVQNVNFRRYTMRLDGFFSWYAKYSGGTILTKPFTFEGNELEINFSTAAYGGIKISICDEDGNEIDGYRSINLFGDSVDRRIDFEKSLDKLNNKPIRLKIELKDANLYSFKFN